MAAVGTAQVQKAKTAYLARLRARGIAVDPFERAHRQEQQHLQQQQQQRSATAAGQSGQAALTALPPPGSAAGAAAGAIVPAGASPQTGGLHGLLGSLENGFSVLRHCTC